MKTPTHEEVAHCAHQLWQDADCPHGRDLEFWLEAERLLATVLTSPASTPTPHATASASSPSPDDYAQAEFSAAQRHEARAPMTPHKIAPKAKPAESGKPLWNQPHSR